MRRVVAATLALSAAAFVHPPAAPKPQQLVVLRGANDESIFSSEKIGKAAFIMIPFMWGVIDWAHPPWYDVVLDAFRG